jgi:hypothetical protein
LSLFVFPLVKIALSPTLVDPDVRLVQFDGLVVIFDCLFVLHLLTIDVSSVDEAGVICGVDLDGVGEVVDSVLDSSLVFVFLAPDVIGIEVVRVKLNDLIKISHGFLGPSEFLVGSGPVFIAIMILGLFLNGDGVFVNSPLVIFLFIELVALDEMLVECLTVPSANFVSHLFKIKVSYVPTPSHVLLQVIPGSSITPFHWDSLTRWTDPYIKNPHQKPLHYQ